MTDVRDSEVADALALHQQGRLIEAEPIYRRIVAAEPDNADALSLLGTLCHQTGRQDEAVELLRRAIALRPGQASWHANLGVALKALERYSEGAEALKEALRLRPDYPEALSNLGLVQHQMGQFEQAVASFERAIGLKPEMAGFHLNLGGTWLHLGKYDEAEACFRRAVAASPRHPAAHSNLGAALLKLGRYAEGEAEMREALRLKPDSAEAMRGLGMALRDQGRMAGSLDAYAKANQLEPGNIRGRQQLLFVENYLGRGTPAEALANARAFDGLLPRPSGVPFRNEPHPERRLRVGFVSGDFRTHPVAQFFGHLVKHFDRSRVETVLYANQTISDQVTARFKQDADLWRPINLLKDDAAEALVREDAIDILVDLSGHTGDNRMPLFARRPAPVQATWLGYSGTTGLSAIDYIIADANVIPPGDEGNYSERPIRLPDAYLCYSPPPFSGLAAEVAPPPAKANGYVTFGSYNKLDKMSDATVACWAKVLKAVPSSKLLLKSGGHSTEEGRRATEARFAAHGVGAGRLELKGPNPSYLLHFQSYSEVDIALDPFPYNGTTTTCDAFYMGVPLVTLVGDRFISRVGSSLNRTLRLDDLVADGVEEYVAIAARLAADLPRLEHLRSQLRSDLLTSPLGDAPRFARNFEAALRQMWRTWCEAQAQ